MYVKIYLKIILKKLNKCKRFKYAEFICNEHSLEISKVDNNGDDSNSMYSVFGSQSGCVLIDRKGRIIYSYICTDNTDWPDVEVLLEQVRKQILKT